MLVSQPDIELKRKGIEILEDAHQRMVARLGVANQESMGTATLLARSLLALNEPPETERAITFLNELIAELILSEEAKTNFAAFIASFYNELANSHAKLGDRSNANNAIDEAVKWATKAYGDDSSIVKRLQGKARKLHREKTK